MKYNKRKCKKWRNLFCTTYILKKDLIVNGEYVKAEDESKLLEKLLNYTENHFVTQAKHVHHKEFVEINNIMENIDKIIYKFDGFSDKRNEIINLNEIIYTNLNPSTYTLIVKTENTKHLFCKPIKMSIIVKDTIAYILD